MRRTAQTLSLTRVLLLVAAACLPPSAASAAQPPWSYVEGGYLNVDFDGEPTSGDNWFAGLSFGGEGWHFVGQYVQGDASDVVEQRDYRLGLGVHGLLGPSADLLAEAYYVRREFDLPGEAVDFDGYRLTGGLRWRPIKLFEAGGFVHYTDLDRPFDSETGYELRGIVYLWRIGIGVSWETSDNFDQYNGFVRFNFGRN